METTLANASRNPATPEEIWAILRETEQIMKKTAAAQEKSQKEEAERWQKLEAERQKEAEQRKVEIEQWRERDAQFERLLKNVGGLNNSVGYLIEILIAAQLWEKFPEYNLQRAYRRIPIFDEKNQEKTDIDILLVNTEWAMAVEVKTDVDNRDIDRHVVRMSRILQYPPALLVPGVKLLGAMAGGVVPPEAAAYAHQCGFFVLELAGESVVRVPAPPEFKPKEW